MTKTTTAKTQEQLEIMRVLVVSTAHITHNDSLLLTEECPHLSINDYRHGWWLHVLDERDIDSEYLDDLVEYGFSPAVGNILSLARDRGCSWVRLDADGPIYDFLAEFHW